jgi:hypothetical protein
MFTQMSYQTVQFAKQYRAEQIRAAEQYRMAAQFRSQPVRRGMAAMFARHVRPPLRARAHPPTEAQHRPAH